MKSGFETKAWNEPVGGKSAFVPPSVEQLAKLFPQLEIIELLGQGGMGAVYKARQPALDRLVALKILSPKSAEDPGFAERFNREARAMAQLNHPNIVAVYDFGQAGDMPYFLMEYVDGVALRQVVQSGKLPPREALQIVLQICEALQFAHDEGVVHRDIKPENVLIDKKGRVKIADFGIAKILEQAPQDISLTGAKDVVGTVHYMAPEQLENPQAVDHRADIFSLGVVFYELLTGELPIGKFQPPSQKVQMDVRLDEVVLHSLEKEPERRYQKASQVKTDVETIAATPDKPAPPLPPAVSPATGISKGWKTAAVVGGLGLVALIVLLGLVALITVTKQKQTPTTAAADLVRSNAFWNLLNEDQCLTVQATDRWFSSFLDARTFDGWSDKERAVLERRLIDALKGPHTSEYYQAISTLAALRSTHALPALREMAFDRGEKNDRDRWMAVRALGIIGDRSVVPELIHLLYHHNSNTRWWAQISLVELTGQNFGKDWNAWGNWWNSQNGQPPFNPDIIRWWRGQAEPNELAESLAESDRKFLEGVKENARKSAATAPNQ
jgi:serine/threonine protein kinase